MDSGNRLVAGSSDSAAQLDSVVATVHSPVPARVLPFPEFIWNDVVALRHWHRLYSEAGTAEAGTAEAGTAEAGTADAAGGRCGLVPSRWSSVRKLIIPEKATPAQGSGLWAVATTLSSCGSESGDSAASRLPLSTGHRWLSRGPRYASPAGAPTMAREPPNSVRAPGCLVELRGERDRARSSPR